MNKEIKNLKQNLVAKLVGSIFAVLAGLLFFGVGIAVIIVAAIGGAIAIDGLVISVMGLLLFGSATADMAIAGINLHKNKGFFKMAKSDEKILEKGKELLAERAKLNEAEAKIGEKTSKIQKAKHENLKKMREVEAAEEAKAAEAKAAADEALRLTLKEK